MFKPTPPPTPLHAAPPPSWKSSLRDAALRLLRTPPAARQMELLESLPLPHRGQACLVRVGQQHFLVGLGSAGVTSIAPVALSAAEPRP